MAITAIDYLVMRTLRQQNVLRENAAMMELGHSNWYGDVPLSQMIEDIRTLVGDKEKADAAIKELEAMNGDARPHMFRVADIFFSTIAGCATRVSIDPGEPDSTYKLDLNHPVQIDRRFDLLVNYGTGEHVFNVAQFYKTAHNLTEPGGVMIHSAPMSGWIDHGFYNFQPTFFIDLAIANGYDISLLVAASLNPFAMVQLTSREQIVELTRTSKLPSNAMIEVAMKRPPEARDFIIPTQGYYGGKLSPQAKQAWHDLR